MLSFVTSKKGTNRL